MVNDIRFIAGTFILIVYMFVMLIDKVFGFSYIPADIMLILAFIVVGILSFLFKDFSE